MGFILSGSGMGGLIFSPLIRALLSAIGPRWTLRALALLVLVVSLPIASMAAPSRFVGRRPTRIDIKLAMKPSFLFSVGAGFLQAGGNGLPLTFLAEYSVVLGYSAGFGATLLAVSNGVNSVSRIMSGFAGDRFGRQNTLILTGILCVISVLGFWLGSVSGGNKVLWIVFVMLYGVTGGGYNALFPTVSLLAIFIFSWLIRVDGGRSLWTSSLCQCQRLHLFRERAWNHVWKSSRRKDSWRK